MPDNLTSSQAVIVTFNLPQDVADQQILEYVYALEDELDETLESAGVGDCDGHEFVDGIGTVYLYGENADDLLEAAKPALTKFPLKPVHIVLRYGAPDDKKAKEKNITLE